jgi:hypothetical protein
LSDIHCQVATYHGITSKIRSSEGTKLPYASAAAGLPAGIQAVQEPQIQTAHDRVLLEFAFLNGLTREARGGGCRWRVSGWRTGRQPVCLSWLEGSSSILRFFDSSP